MTGIEVPCPLCELRFDSDEAYAAHLADAHGLMDDEGTETTLVQAVVAAGDPLPDARAADAPDEALALAPVRPAIDPSRIYDPDADSDRYRVAVIGLAGLMVIGLAFGGISLAFDSDEDGGGSGPTGQEMAASPTTAVVDLALATPTTVAKGPSALSAETVVVVTTTTAPPSPAPSSGSGGSTGGGSTGPAPVPAPAPAPSPGPAPAPVYSPPTVSGAGLQPCTTADPPRRNVTWHYEFTLSGGSNWAPPATATPLGGGRYADSIVGRETDGFPVTSIRITDTLTGAKHDVALSPSLAGQACPK